MIIFMLNGYYKDKPEEKIGMMFKSLEERKTWVLANRGYFITEDISEKLIDTFDELSNGSHYTDSFKKSPTTF